MDEKLDQILRNQSAIMSVLEQTGPIVICQKETYKLQFPESEEQIDENRNNDRR